MKKPTNTPTLSSKRPQEDSLRTIPKQPNPPKTITDSTPKEDFKDNDVEIFPLMSIRNGHHSSKENQNLSEFRSEIEKRYKRSVMNKIYSFPRAPNADFSEDSSLDSIRSLETYALSSQNYERRNNFELRKSGEFSGSQDKNPTCFDKEIQKLNKEIEYYKNHQMEKLSKSRENPQRENHFKGEKPHYIKLLNILEQNNDLDMQSCKKNRTPSNSQSCLHKKDVSSKRTPNPNRLKTEKTPCTFDKKIARTFENCCEKNDGFQIDIEAIESSDFRSLSRGRAADASRSKSRRNKPLRVLSPNSLTYMNDYLYDKEFRQESIKKIYSNSIVKSRDVSKERKNNFKEEEEKKKEISSKQKKPLKKLYLIHDKENVNSKKKCQKMEEDKKKTFKNPKPLKK